MRLRRKSSASRWSSGFPRHEAGRARHSHELREPAGFCFRDRGAERRDAVVAPPLVVFVRRRALARLDDQALLEHPLNRAIQRARTQLQLAAGALRHVLDDGVAVAVLVGDREKNVKGRRRQREERVRLALQISHATEAIATVDILSIAIARSPTCSAFTAPFAGTCARL